MSRSLEVTKLSYEKSKLINELNVLKSELSQIATVDAPSYHYHHKHTNEQGELDDKKNVDGNNNNARTFVSTWNTHFAHRCDILQKTAKRMRVICSKCKQIREKIKEQTTLHERAETLMSNRQEVVDALEQITHINKISDNLQREWENYKTKEEFNIMSRENHVDLREQEYLAAQEYMERCMITRNATNDFIRIMKEYMREIMLVNNDIEHCNHKQSESNFGDIANVSCKATTLTRSTI